MNTSSMFTINVKDVVKGLVVAVLTGVALPVLAIFQTPGFDIATTNWHAVLVLAENGALAGFAGYIIKNFFSNNQGQVLGKIG